MGIRWLSRYKVLAALVAAGTAVVLLCFAMGLWTKAEQLRFGRGSQAVGVDIEAAADRAAADRAADERAADDRATADKVAAAKAADARAAEARAARAKAAEREQARRQVVAMPALVGLKLDIAMDVAADAGLTGISVCRTPGDDTPLWWPNWRIVDQDVRVGTRVDAGREICLSATKD